MGLLGKNKDGSKKKFKDTKIGIFLKEKAPDILDKIGDVLPDKGAIGVIKNIISKNDTLSEEDKQKAIELLNHELEMYKIDAGDRANARDREVQYVKANRVDWMMIFAGATALCVFIALVIAVLIWPDSYKDSPIFHQLMGVIEGVALTIFAYYYGSSKGSSDKTKILSDKN